MKQLIIEATQQTPYIYLDADKGYLKISGFSIPEDPYATFNPVRDWVLEYIKSPAPKTVFELDIPYYNTSSFKYVVSIIKILEKIDTKKHKVIIKWHQNHDEEDEIVNAIINLPFKLIKKKN